MFPFWEIAIAPLLEAGGVHRLVEIGALRGENTRQIIERLGPRTELHVIDPKPAFDPREHEQQFAGQYVFHQDLSLNVLGDLPPMDAALIDGDHNWYTVYNELRLLREVARGAGAPLPLLILHDVLWPYGRRDLYYDPESVPEAYRQPWRQAGMRPERKDLLERGGLNPTMCNAELEGGQRNGVMTGLDDFLAEHDRPVRTLVLPMYFGLAIVVEEELIARRPQVGQVLDHLDSREAKHALLELGEQLRLRAMAYQHDVLHRGNARFDRATARYLELLKGALLNEHYLEDEARMAHLTSRMAAGREVDVRLLRDPVRQDVQTYPWLHRQRTGASGPDDRGASAFTPFTAMGRPRLDHLHRCLDQVFHDDIAGDLVDCSTARGGGAIFMRAFLEALEMPKRQVWVADRFRAAPDDETTARLPKNGVAGLLPDLNIVREGFQRFGLLDDRVRFLQGALTATLPDAPIRRIALLRLGHGIGSEAGVALDELYERVSVGGFVIVDDHAEPECANAIEGFRADHGIASPLQVIDGSAVGWRKAADERAAPAPARTPVAMAPRAPLAPPQPDGAIDLTVVVVFYNMRREAARTLHSLSRAYQEGVADLDYEVVVLENGSAGDQRLSAEFVESFGPEFRYFDLGATAERSPVHALNLGVREGRGRAFALMIDGAHVLSPGVLQYGIKGLTTYHPAIVATQQWYVGPGQQGEAMDDGYDQAYEDRLFESIGWPNAGYRIFEISHFIGDRDWLDGVWESNCLFVTRDQLAQVGAYDESFSVAGGGYANLELYERLATDPATTVATILGEGSFHQIHGGTTTNQPDASERRARVFGYSQEFASLRGRDFRGPGKPLAYVGRIGSPAARRTKPRRLSSAAFSASALPGGVDGPPDHPTPVPEELVWQFTEAVWRSLPAEHTTWLGRRIETAPSDLLAYQEMISRSRPDWIIETGTGNGGRSLFLASMCDIVGHGSVLSIDDSPADDLPEHERLHFLRGRPHDPATVTAAHERIGPDASALVVLGSQVDRWKTMSEFDAYAHLVPVGGYVVVADTIVNGHPVWPGYGPGPLEAVKQLLARHGDFVADSLMEKYSSSFNPSGYLLRVR